jgi:WD40 repeat protein
MTHPAVGDPSAIPALSSLWRMPLQENSPFPRVVFSPSGALIAAGTLTGADSNSLGSLTVFDARAGAVVRAVSDDWQIDALAFSPDSRWLATSESRFHLPGLDEQRLRIIDASTFAERCHFPGTLEAVPDSLAFGRDGSWVVGSLTDFGPATRVFAFDAATGTERWRHSFRLIRTFVLSQDSTTIAVAGTDGVLVLDALNGTQRLQIAPPADIWDLAYSPDSRRIAVGCGDGTAHVFDAGTGAALWSAQTVTGHTGSVVSIAISDDSRWVAAHSVVGTTAGLLSVYDIEQGTPRFSPAEFTYFGVARFSPALCDLVLNVPYGSGPHVSPVGFSVVDARTGALRASSPAGQVDFAVAPDGTSIAVAGEPFAALYASGLVVSSLTVDASPTAIAMSPAGTPLVAVADTEPGVTVFTAADGNLLARKPVPGAIADVVFADSGQAVVTGGAAGVRLFSVVGDQSWKADTIGPVNALAAAGPRGDWLATAAGRTVRLLNSTDGHERWSTPNTHPQSVTRIAASPDGAWIATGCADRTTRILDAATGAQAFSVTGDGKVRALAFQPPRTMPGTANEDGSIVLVGTANEDGSIVLVDAATATERGRISRLVGCAHIAFGFDGMTLAAAWDDNTVSIHDITAAGTPPELLTFTVTAPVTALAVNPSDGSIAVSIADGTSAVARDPHSGIELIRLLHPAPVVGAAISADGALVATTCADNIVRVWRSGARGIGQIRGS